MEIITVINFAIFFTELSFISLQSKFYYIAVVKNVHKQSD